MPSDRLKSQNTLVDVLVSLNTYEPKALTSRGLVISNVPIALLYIICMSSALLNFMNEDVVKNFKLNPQFNYSFTEESDENVQYLLPDALRILNRPFTVKAYKLVNDEFVVSIAKLHVVVFFFNESYAV